IAIDDNVTDHHSGYSEQSDSLMSEIFNTIDFDRLGFQNFDGKNLMLYKNIAHINRNKAKFAQPSNELLDMYLPCVLVGDLFNLNQSRLLKTGEDDQPNEVEHPRHYSKTYCYSVLESMIDSDSQLRQLVKNKSFRFPDC